jgi:hypothetical protein
MDVLMKGAKVTRSNRSWIETITLDVWTLDSVRSGEVCERIEWAAEMVAELPDGTSSSAQILSL